jgi:hypothetical protein
MEALVKTYAAKTLTETIAGTARKRRRFNKDDFLLDMLLNSSVGAYIPKEIVAHPRSSSGGTDIEHWHRVYNKAPFLVPKKADENDECERWNKTGADTRI